MNPEENIKILTIQRKIIEHHYEIAKLSIEQHELVNKQYSELIKIEELRLPNSETKDEEEVLRKDGDTFMRFPHSMKKLRKLSYGDNSAGIWIKKIEKARKSKFSSNSKKKNKLTTNLEGNQKK